MDDRVSFMEDEADDPIVHFIDYIKTRGVSFSPIFVVEGIDDPKFYTSNIQFIFNDNFEIISVGNKGNVLEVRSMIRSNISYSSDLVAFLVDRDFDDTESEEDLYVTPTYSIENLYCQPSTFKALVSSEYGLSNISIDRNNKIKKLLLDEFNRLQTSFHKNKKVIFINAIFMFVRKKLSDKKISLDKIAKIEISFAEGELKIKLSKKKLFSILRNNHRESFIEFIKNDEKWNEKCQNPLYYFRGKQELLFLRIILEQLKDGKYFYLMAQNKTAQDHFIKFKENSIDANILSSVSQYVTTPTCLRDFLLSLHQKKTIEK